MRYEYTLTFADFKAAQRLFYQRTPKQRFHFVLWLRVMPVVGLMSLGLLLTRLFAWNSNQPPLLLGILTALAYLGLRGAIMRPIVHRRMFKDLNPDGAGGHALSLEFTGSELVLRVPGKSEARFLPPAFCGMAEDDKIVLLLVNDKTFMSIPKRVMPPEGWAELRAWFGTAGKAVNPC